MEIYNSTSITCQKSKISICHVQFSQHYLSKIENLNLPCTIPTELPVKYRKSQFAMYNSANITCQISKASICHVQFQQNYLPNIESLNLPCTIQPALPVKYRKSQFAMYNSARWHVSHGWKRIKLLHIPNNTMIIE